MTNHETTTNFQDERVAYKDWLRQPVFRTFWWSPAGAHVDALLQIGRGENVTGEVIEALKEENIADSPILLEIEYWNSLDGDKKGTYGRYIREDILTTRIVDHFDNNPQINVAFTKYFEHFSGKRPVMTAADGKRDILNVAVYQRGFQLAQDPGFQGT